MTRTIPRPKTAQHVVDEMKRLLGILRFEPRYLGNNCFEYAYGKILRNVHAEKLCQGRNCVVHNPSNHAMRSFPLHWRDDRYMFERICKHGIGHPDPDHMLWYRLTFGHESARYEGVHGCDGCCGE